MNWPLLLKRLIEYHGIHSAFALIEQEVIKLATELNWNTNLYTELLDEACAHVYRDTVNVPKE